MSDSVEIEVDRRAFTLLEELVTGRRDDVQSVAATLGVTRQDFSRALLRSLTSRGRSFTFGPVLERLGIAPDELLADAAARGEQFVTLLGRQAPDVFPAPSPDRRSAERGFTTASVGAVAFSRADPEATADQRPAARPATEAGALLARRYVVEGRLGAGGQATVCRVVDLALGRPAAVKLFHAALRGDRPGGTASREADSGPVPPTIRPDGRTGPRFDHHFLRELELLRGPGDRAGVLPLLDWGCQGDAPFLVFPLCVTDLSKLRPREESLDARQVAGWVRGAAEALHGLHAAGVVHADVKPHNLLLDEAGGVLLADFGLACVTGDPEPEHFRGTLNYMSPEQLCIQPLDGRSDVYSLGVTLYELLAGRPPFKASRTTRDEIETLRRRVLFEEPPPLPSSTPEGLKSVCRKALARDPGDRFASAAEMARALARWLHPWWRGLLRRLLGVPAGRRVRPDPPPADMVAFHRATLLVEPKSWRPWDQRDRADVLRYLMLAHAHRGDWEEAFRSLDPAWEEHLALDDPPSSAQFLWDASRVCARGGDRDRAISLAQSAQDVYRELNSPMEELVNRLLAEWGVRP